MSFFDNPPLFLEFQSNSEISKFDNEPFNFIKSQNYNSHGFREYSLFNDFSFYEELNEKHIPEKVYFKENPEEKAKKNTKEFPLENPDDDTKRKENIEKQDLDALIQKDKVITANQIYSLSQSNSEILKLDNESFYFNESQDFNFHGIQYEYSLDNSDKVYFEENPKEEVKKRAKELHLEKPNDDTKRKENIEKKDLVGLLKKDKVIIVNTNFKNLQEQIKEKNIESQIGVTKKTKEQTKLLKEVEKKSENKEEESLNKKRKPGRKSTKFPKNEKENDMFSEYNLSSKFKRHFLN